MTIGDATWQANATAMRDALDALARHREQAAAGGGAKAVKRHADRGRLPARERVDLLLDRGAPFLDLCALAGLHEGGVPGAGMIGGIGRVDGRDVMITATDPTVQGGAVTPWGLQRSARLSQIAMENRLPEVHLVESAGADLANQADLFVPGGAAFRNLARRSAEGLPTLAVVFGPSTAGGAYIPGMSELTVLVRGQAALYLAGPPLVAMALGEEVDEETLGGAVLHTDRTGSGDFLAESDADAIHVARRLVARFPGPRSGPISDGPPPLGCADDLLGLPSADLRIPFDIRDVFARLVDGSVFDEFKPRYGPSIVAGWADLGGQPIGLMANHGVLQAEGAEKGAQFVSWCQRHRRPLLFLHNVTGFMVGKDAEARGIIKAGAKLIAAVSTATVPAVTLMVGASFGAGNYALMGRAYQPRFVFSWPSHRIAVMGGTQLAGVLDRVRRDSARKSGRPVDEAELETLKAMMAQKVDHESTCWSATGRLWDDGIIDPRETRDVLRWAFDIARRAPGPDAAAAPVTRH